MSFPHPTHPTGNTNIPTVQPPNLQMPPPRLPVRAPGPPQICSFLLGQEVEVLLRTNIWVVGIVIGTLKFFEKFAGWGYKISYRFASQPVFDEFPSENVRPRNNPAP